MRQPPPVLIDHVFVCTDIGAPEAQRLVEFGLTEGASNTHPGQGTANRRFFFRSTMLELLWVSDPDEARSEVTRPTLIWERWSHRWDSACPFGIMLRPGCSQLPFAAWEYKPSYLPPPHAMHIASEATVDEPMWIYAAFLNAATRVAEHAAGLQEITAVRLTSPPAPNARVTRAMAEMGVISLATGPAHLLELEFDAAGSGQSADFRPDLPLVFRW